MKQIALLLCVVSLAACSPAATATPVPTATAEPTAVRVATWTPRPTARPEPTTRPKPTLPPVPSDPAAFAQYIIDTYSAFDGEDLGVTGDYMWLEGSENHLIINVSKGMFGPPYNGLDVIKDEGRVEDWAAPLVRDMESFASGAPWHVWYARRHLETDAAEAGADSVTWKDWMYVSDDYDTDAGGFWVTDYPIRISKPDIAQKGRVSLMFMPFKRDRMAGYFLSRAR